MQGGSLVASRDCGFPLAQRSRNDARPTPSSLCESEPKFWKLSPKAAAANKPAFIDMLVLALFLLMAVVSTASCFAELSYLMQSDAIGRSAMHAIRGGDSELRRVSR